MILNKLIISDPVYQINKDIITLKDLRLLLDQKLIEVPVVLKGEFLGILQRKSLVDYVLTKSSLCHKPINHFVIEPDQKLKLNDSTEDILHKINCTKFRILPVFDERNMYIATLNLNSLLKAILNEKEYLIHHYESFFYGIENLN